LTEIIYNLGERSGHLTNLYGEKLYVFGGKGQSNRPLSDLWVLNLGNILFDNRCVRKSIAEMRWKELKNKGIKPVFTSPSWIVTHDKLLFLCDGNNNSTLSYSFSKNEVYLLYSKLDEESWEIFSPGIPPKHHTFSEFLICRDSNILFLSQNGTFDDRTGNSLPNFFALYSLRKFLSLFP